MCLEIGVGGRMVSARAGEEAAGNSGQGDDQPEALFWSGGGRGERALGGD